MLSYWLSLKRYILQVDRWSALHAHDCDPQLFKQFLRYHQLTMAQLRRMVTYAVNCDTTLNLVIEDGWERLDLRGELHHGQQFLEELQQELGAGSS